MNFFLGKNNIPAGEIKLLQSDDKEVYLGGETLSGQLVLKHDKPISTKNLRLSFIGELRSHDVPPATMAAPPMPLYRNIELYRANIQLSLPRGQNSTVEYTEKLGGPLFEFEIPKNLPPSTNRAANTDNFGNSSYVSYRLSLEYTEYGKKDKVITILPIHVFPVVSSVENPADIELNAPINDNRHEISFNLKVTPPFFLWDAKLLNFEFSINNPKSKKIEYIEFQFIQKCKVRGTVYRKILGDVKIDATSNWANQNYQRNFSIPLGSTPSALPPTYECYPNVSGNSDFIVSYVLKVKAGMSGFRNNIKLEIPVFVCNNQ